MTWPAIMVWILILVGFGRPATFALYLFFCITIFSDMSLLPPEIIGNVPPETLCSFLLIFKTFSTRKRLISLLNYALDMRKLGLLGAFSVYAAVTALIYPRLFAGRVRLYALNSASNLSPLGPTSANITQPVYMLISIGIGFVFAYSGQRPEFRRHFLYAILLNAFLLLSSGIINLGFDSIGQEGLLAPFHNATYHLLDTVSIAGQSRVVGFAPEASIYGAACCTSLAFLLFNRRSYEERLRKWVVTPLIVGLIYMVYASTSSGAYVGLGVIISVATARFILEMVFTKRFTPNQLRAIIIAIASIFGGGIGALFLPHSFIVHMTALLNATLFQKSQSFSYIQRTSWTKAGEAAFWSTYGMGVGVGSVRTSNWIVNFAASTGIVGLVLFGGFTLRTLFAGKAYATPKIQQLATGMKLALLPGLVVNALSGTTPNPGGSLMLSLGLIYALQQRKKLKLPMRSAPPLPIPIRSPEPPGRSEPGLA